MTIAEAHATERFARTEMLQAGGKSLDDAQAMAEEALALHVD